MSAQKLTVGASDIAAIMNVDPFKSAVELWRQRVENEPFAGNEDTERGKHFEKATCDWYCSRWVANVSTEPLWVNDGFGSQAGSPHGVIEQLAMRHPKLEWCRATPDLVVRAVPIQQTEPGLLVVDVKIPRSPSKIVKGSSPPVYEKKWDESSQVAPVGYRLQSIWQQGVARAAGVEVVGGELAAGLFFGKLHRVFVPFDEEMFALCLERAERWLSYVKSGEPLPPEFQPNEEAES